LFSSAQGSGKNRSKILLETSGFKETEKNMFKILSRAEKIPGGPKKGQKVANQSS
jgi:hypothetical protein